jgi:nitric oxide reductase NorE protein
MATITPDAPGRSRKRSRPEKRLPGEIGIWMFILGDLTAFSMLFGIFIAERSTQVAVFNESRETLKIAFGAANTLILLTGSMFVVQAMNAIRSGDRTIGRRWLVAAGACGVIFGINKVFEYASKFSAGHGPYANDFYMYFFGLTGIHLLHVIIGLFVLLHMWRIAGRPGELSAVEVETLENGASYWHLVDLLWIVLFALLYLMG